jgi:G patch domain-containing protein 1
VRRAVNLADDESEGKEKSAAIHLFAPENPPMIAFVRKLDRKGLRSEGETPLESTFRRTHTDANDSDPEDAFFGQRLAGKTTRKEDQPAPRGAWGVGVLNDTGSDDEDPYTMGPQISYHRTLGGEKKRKKPAGTRPTIGSSNPLLRTKPVFISRKSARAKSSGGFRKCHDGRLPLDRFLLAEGISTPSLSSPEQAYTPPEIPPDWKSSKRPTGERRVDLSIYGGSRSSVHMGSRQLIK